MCAMNPRLLRPILSGDPDVLRYIAAVQQADGQSLEPAVKKAITDFVTGCKEDGIWDAIKSSCILAGAKTLNGALTPLVGAAVDPYNFTASDYNRLTGLKGDAATTYLDTNYNPSSLSTLSLSVWLAEAGDDGAYIGAVDSTPVSTDLRTLGSSHASFLRATNLNVATSRVFGTLSTVGGLVAATLTGTAHTHRSGSSNFVGTVTVQADPDLPITVFQRNAAGGPSVGTASRIAFYHIGEALDLEALDTRVSALITAIGNS